MRAFSYGGGVQSTAALDQLTTDEEQLTLFDNQGSDCETGYCMT